MYAQYLVEWRSFVLHEDFVESSSNSDQAGVVAGLRIGHGCFLIVEMSASGLVTPLHLVALLWLCDYLMAVGVEMFVFIGVVMGIFVCRSSFGDFCSIIVIVARLDYRSL